MAQQLSSESLDNALKPVQATKNVVSAASEVKKVKGIVEDAQEADDYLAKIESIAKIADSMLGKFLSAQEAFKGIAEKKGVLESDANNEHRQNKLDLRDKGQGVQQQPMENKKIQLRVDKEFTEEYIKTIGELLDNVPDDWKEKSIGDLIEMYENEGMMVKLFKKRIVSELMAYAEQAVRID